MTPQTKAPNVSHYTADVERPPSGGFLRSLRLADALSVLAFAAALLTALGWRYYSPAHEELERKLADSTQNVRIMENSKRIDDLSARLQFTNYLQCVQLRKTDPVSLPSDCAPIILQRARP